MSQSNEAVRSRILPLLSLPLMALVLDSCRTPPAPPPQVIVVPRLSPATGGCQGVGHDVCCDEDSMDELVKLAQQGRAVQQQAQQQVQANDGGSK